MLKPLALFMATVSLAVAADDLSLKALTQKATNQAVSDALVQLSLLPPVKKLPWIRLEQFGTAPAGTLVCAIPLKEIRGGKNIDPIALPSIPRNFDHMARSASIPACPNSP